MARADQVCEECKKCRGMGAQGMIGARPCQTGRMGTCNTSTSLDVR